MPFFTAAFFINAAITAATSLYARHQANKAQAEAQNAAATRNINLRPSGSGHDSGIAYGYCVVPARVVHTAIGASIPAHSTAYIGAIGGMPNDPSGTSGINLSGFNVNAYKGTGAFGGILGAEDVDAHQLEIFVVSTGEVQELVDLWLNQKSIKSDYQIANVALAKLYQPGTVPQMASIFVPGEGDGRRITATDKFSGKSHVSLLTWQNSNDPQFGAGTTDGLAFMRGRPLNHIRRTGTAGNYSYSYGSPSFTSAMALVRLDYLLNSLYGPRGLTFEDHIHAPSWYEAQQRSSQRLIDFKNTVAPGVKTEDGELVPDPAYVTTYENIPRLGNSNFKQTGAIEGYPSQGTRGAVFSELTTKVNRRYEFNAWIETGMSYLQVKRDMLQCAGPGAIEFIDHEGKLRLSIPDPYTDAADQSTATFNDSTNIPDSVEVSLPNNNSKLNKVTISFTDLELDGAQSDAVFPESGSPLETQLLALDNGKVLHQTIQLTGVGDHAHAYSLAASMCLTSRRRTYQWESKYSMYNTCEGDIVRLIDSEKSIDDYVRITAKQPMPDVIGWSAISFKKTDYGFYPEADRQVLLPPRLNLDLPNPTNVTASHDESINTTTIQWEIESSVNLYAFEVQHRLAAKNEWNTIAFVPKSEGTTARHPVEEGTWTHIYRVRSIAVTGGFGPWVRSARVSVTNASTITEQLGLGECPPRERGSVGQIWVSLTEAQSSQFVKGPDPFLFSQRTDDDTPSDGLNGQGLIWMNFRKQDIDGLDPVSTLSFSSAPNVRPKLPPSLVPEGGGAVYLDHLKYNKNTQMFELRLCDNSDGTQEGNDRRFSPEVGGDLAIGFRSGRDLYYWTRIPQIIGTRTSGDYTWIAESPEEAEAYFGLVHAPLVALYRYSRRCSMDPNNPWVPLAELPDNRTETIYGSSTEDVLQENQKPDDLWTLEEVRASQDEKIERNGVVWSTTLVGSEFSLAREYGFTATRDYPFRQVIGTSVAEPWETELTHHWGVKTELGTITRKIYGGPAPAARRQLSNLEDLIKAGGTGYNGRWLFKKGNTRIFDDWSTLHTADRVVISPRDRGGWPNLVLQDIRENHRIGIEPQSSKWMFFTVVEVVDDNEFRIEFLSKQDGNKQDIVSPFVDFYFSVERREKPSYTSSLLYNNAISERAPGGYQFYRRTGTPPNYVYTALIGDSFQFQNIVVEATHVRMNYEDSGRGAVLKEMLERKRDTDPNLTFEISEDQWVSWRMGETDTSNKIYAEIALEKLVAYDLPPKLVRVRAYDETIFRFPFEIPDKAETFAFTISGIPAVVNEGTTGISWVGTATGSVEGALALVPPPELKFNDDYGAAITSRYRLIPTTIAGDRAIGGIVLPRTIEQDVLLRLEATGVKGRYSDRDFHNFTHKNTTSNDVRGAIAFFLPPGVSDTTFQRTGTGMTIQVLSGSKNVEMRGYLLNKQQPSASFLWYRRNRQNALIEGFDLAGPTSARSRRVFFNLPYQAGRGASWTIRALMFARDGPGVSRTNNDTPGGVSATIVVNQQAEGQSDPHRPQRQQSAGTRSLPMKVGESLQLVWLDQDNITVEAPAASNVVSLTLETAGSYDVTAEETGTVALTVKQGATTIETINVTATAADSASLLSASIEDIDDLKAAGDPFVLFDRVDGSVEEEVQRFVKTNLGTLSTQNDYRGQSQEGKGRALRLYPPLSVASRQQGTVTEEITSRGETRTITKTFNVDPTPAAEFAAAFTAAPSTLNSGSSTRMPSVSFTGTGVASYTEGEQVWTTDTGFFSAGSVPTDDELETASKTFVAANNAARPYLNILVDSVSGRTGNFQVEGRLDTASRKYFYELSNQFGIGHENLEVDWTTESVQQEADVVRLQATAPSSLLTGNTTWRFQILSEDGGFLSASATSAGTSASSVLASPYWHLPLGSPQEIDVLAVAKKGGRSASSILRVSVVPSDLAPTLTGLPVSLNENAVGVALVVGSTGGNANVAKTYEIAAGTGNFGASRGGSVRSSTATSVTWWPPADVSQDTTAGFIVKATQGQVSRTRTFTTVVKHVPVPPTYMVEIKSTLADSKRRLSYTRTGTATGGFLQAWSVNAGFALSAEDENPTGNTETTSSVEEPYIWQIDSNVDLATVSLLSQRQGIFANDEEAIAYGPPAVPTGLALESRSLALGASWNKVPGASSYEIRHKVSTAQDSAYSAWTDTGDVDEYEIQFANLDNLSFTVQIRAKNSFGTSAASAGVTQIITGDVASLVLDGDRTVSRYRQITLAWMAAPTATSYEVRSKVSTASSYGTWTDIGNQTSRSFTNLADATAYDFQVRGRNAEGVGPTLSERLVTPTVVTGNSYTMNVRTWGSANVGGIQYPPTFAARDPQYIVPQFWLDVTGTNDQRLFRLTVSNQAADRNNPLIGPHVRFASTNNNLNAEGALDGTIKFTLTPSTGEAPDALEIQNTGRTPISSAMAQAWLNVRNRVPATVLVERRAQQEVSFEFTPAITARTGNIGLNGLRWNQPRRNADFIQLPNRWFRNLNQGDDTRVRAIFFQDNAQQGNHQYDCIIALYGPNRSRRSAPYINLQAGKTIDVEITTSTGTKHVLDTGITDSTRWNFESSFNGLLNISTQSPPPDSSHLTNAAVRAFVLALWADRSNTPWTLKFIYKDA